MDSFPGQNILLRRTEGELSDKQEDDRLLRIRIHIISGAVHFSSSEQHRGHASGGHPEPGVASRDFLPGVHNYFPDRGCCLHPDEIHPDNNQNNLQLVA